MAEKWRRYESVVLMDPELGPEGTDALIAKVREYVAQEEGRILKTERWGLRDTAFELKGRRRAYYYVLEFAGGARVATELDRRLNLVDTVLKFQTIKLDEAVDPASLPEVEEEIGEPATEAAQKAEAKAAPSGDDEDAAEAEGGGADEEE